MRRLLLIDRALPYLGPAFALVLGVVGLGRRSLDVDEAAVVAAAHGSFTDVVERAFSDDPARAGYIAVLQPVVRWNDAEEWIRLPSVVAAVIAAIAIYRLGRRLAGRHAGAAASLVLASSMSVVGLSRTVGPLALALAAMLLSSAFFARAVERGNALWWAVYAVSAALLPLTHPVAASALVAQLAAIAVARKEIDLRLALPAVAVAVVESGLFLTAAMLDRADAEDGAGPLELGDLGVGLGNGLGWNVVVAALAVWGVVVLVRRVSDGRGPLETGARRRPRARPARGRARGRRSPCPCTRAPRSRSAPVASPSARVSGSSAIADRRLRARRRRRPCGHRARGARGWTSRARRPRTGAPRQSSCGGSRRCAAPSSCCPSGRDRRSRTTRPRFASPASAGATR